MKICINHLLHTLKGMAKQTVAPPGLKNAHPSPEGTAVRLGQRFKLGTVIVTAAITCAPTLAAKKLPPPPMDVAFIISTGSTNTTGYRVDVFTDGSCGIENTYTREVLSEINKQHPNQSPFDAFEEGKLPVSIEQKFMRDVKAAMPLAQLPVNHMFKSVSFGTSTYVEYKRQRTPDLSSPADARGQALAADVKTIVATLGLKNLPRHPIVLGH